MTSPPTSSMGRPTWREVIGRRVQRQGLGEEHHRDVVDTVAAMCGAHAQVRSAGEISVALRTRNTTRADVQAALTHHHDLVKTFGPRGTVHLLPTRDLPLWTAAMSGIPSDFGGGSAPLVSTTRAEEIISALTQILRDAELTVDEVTSALAEYLGPWSVDPVMPAFRGAWPRWRAVTAVAAHRGVLCFGAPRGRKVTYTNPHRFLSDTAPVDTETATSDLLYRYLASYGPGTPEGFARWIGAPRSWVVALFHRNEDRLERVDVEGTDTWVNAGDPIGWEPARGIRLLPYFDAYSVAAYPREVAFPGVAAQRALNRGQAGNYPVLLIDGTVAGVWHHRLSGRRLHLTVEPLVALTTSQARDLDRCVQRLEHILDARASLTIGPVTVGPHA